MYNVVILWAPDSAENRRVAEAMRAALDAGKFTAIAKKAAESSIVDVVAADLIVIGLQKSGAAEVPTEYFELMRIFKGITLAGRAAAVFSVGAEKASQKIRKSLKDTEISLFEDDPIFVDQKSDKVPEAGEWARKVAGFLEEVRVSRA